jgi:Fe-S-cluster-containing dehydrogenase component
VPRKKKLKVPGYQVKKCRICGAKFLLGPLDPKGIDVCPIHAFALLSEGNLSKKEAKELRRYASRRS